MCEGDIFSFLHQDKLCDCFIYSLDALLCDLAGSITWQNCKAALI